MSFLFEILNRASEFVLALDPEGAEQLRPLEGKVVHVECTVPRLDVYVSVSPGGLLFEASSRAEPDVSLRGSALAFAQLGLGGIEDGPLGDGQVTMQGDVHTGQAFQKALSRLDIDWEEGLARYVGDTPARKMGNVARGFGDWSRESAAYSRENIADFLSEESKLLVSEVAMERFEAGVSNLRSDVDRLEQRMARLSRRLEQDREGKS